MLSLRKVSRSNAEEVEKMFNGLIDFVVNDDGKVVEVVICRPDLNACINVRFENYGLLVDLTDYNAAAEVIEEPAKMSESYKINNFSRVEKVIESKFSGITYINDFLFATSIDGMSDAEILIEYRVFHDHRVHSATGVGVRLLDIQRVRDLLRTECPEYDDVDIINAFLSSHNLNGMKLESIVDLFLRFYHQSKLEETTK